MSNGRHFCTLEINMNNPRQPRLTLKRSFPIIHADPKPHTPKIPKLVRSNAICFDPDELVPHDNRCLQCVVDSEPECLHGDDTDDEYDNLEFTCLECKVGQTDGKTQICEDCINELWRTTDQIHENTQAHLETVHACDDDDELEEMLKCLNCGEKKSAGSQWCKLCIQKHMFRII